jgi:hypothetical protein
VGDTGTPLLSDAERRALAGLLDVVIPPSGDGTRPGAGALGVAAHVERAVAATPDQGPLVRQGLAALAALVRERGASDLAALAPPEREAAVRELAQRQPGFFGMVVFHAYAGYYHDPRVLEALGLEPRAPFPQGHEVPPTDFTLLDPVRRRGPLYRKC